MQVLILHYSDCDKIKNLTSSFFCASHPPQMMQTARARLLKMFAVFNSVTSEKPKFVLTSSKQNEIKFVPFDSLPNINETVYPSKC